MDTVERNPAGRHPSWETIHSDTLLDSHWLRVRRQRVRTASGFEIEEYYVVDAPDIVVVLALTEAREAILVHQYRHGVAHDVLELPAGILEADESPASAVGRELLEETGYRAGRIEPLATLYPSTARQSNRTHCFLALDCRWAAEQSGDPAEDIEVRLLSLPELRAVARQGDFPSQTSLSCLFLGLERLSEDGPA